MTGITASTGVLESVTPPALPTLSSQKAQLLPLTGLRFFLALWVIAFHQPFFEGYSWMAAFPVPIQKLFHTGYVAVGVFFALSGFVLSYKYPLGSSWSSADLRRFLVARVARIYPAYAIGLLLSAPWVILALEKQFSLMTVCREAGKATLTWMLLQGWTPWTAEAWNGPGWSLSAEWFFYCSFPFIGVALWRLSRLRSLLVAGFIIWGLALLGPLIAVRIPLLDNRLLPVASWDRDSAGAWVKVMKFTPLLQLPQFAIGIILGRGYHLLRDQNSALLGKGYWLYLPGLLLEVLTIGRCQSDWYLFLHNGLLIPLHALIILGFALDGGLLSRILSRRPLILLGNASYSMYIFHLPVAAWISMIGKHLLSTNLVGAQITVVFLVFLIGFSCFVFKLIEEPLNRGLKKTLKAKFGVS